MGKSETKRELPGNSETPRGTSWEKARRRAAFPAISHFKGPALTFCVLPHSQSSAPILALCNGLLRDRLKCRCSGWRTTVRGGSSPSGPSEPPCSFSDTTSEKQRAALRIRSVPLRGRVSLLLRCVVCCSLPLITPVGGRSRLSLALLTVFPGAQLTPSLFCFFPCGYFLLSSLLSGPISLSAFCRLKHRLW